MSQSQPFSTSLCSIRAYLSYSGPDDLFGKQGTGEDVPSSETRNAYQSTSLPRFLLLERVAAITTTTTVSKKTSPNEKKRPQSSQTQTHNEQFFPRYSSSNGSSLTTSISNSLRAAFMNCASAFRRFTHAK
jgi:hypothetical protein